MYNVFWDTMFVEEILKHITRIMTKTYGNAKICVKTNYVAEYLFDGNNRGLVQDCATFIANTGKGIKKGREPKKCFIKKIFSE
jgi:hypothetical protein